MKAVRESFCKVVLDPQFVDIGVGHTVPEWLAQRLRDGLGAVCIFGPNIVSRAQLRELTAAIHAENPLAVIAIDEEGGDVTRLYYESGSPYPGNAILGRLDDLERTERVGAISRSVSGLPSSWVFSMSAPDTSMILRISE